MSVDFKELSNRRKSVNTVIDLLKSTDDMWEIKGLICNLDRRVLEDVLEKFVYIAKNN